MDNVFGQLEVISEVAIAMLLGGVVGLERERTGKPAGFRTHMLVAGTAALLIGLVDALIGHMDFNVEHGNVNLDPARIVQAIVIGVGFLGAGTIFKHHDEDTVEGLTTAASVLLAGGIGISVGLRQFVTASGVTLLALMVLISLRMTEGLINEKKRRRKF